MSIQIITWVHKVTFSFSPIEYTEQLLLKKKKKYIKQPQFIET